MTNPKSIEELALLEDEPVPSHKVDELQLLPYARVVAGTALGTQGPFTIGVYADWGQGKSSVLRQAKSLIDDEAFDNTVTVWFNAWQFEKEEHPIIPLIASIVRAVDRKQSERKKAGQTPQKGWSNISRALRAVAYGFSVKATVKVPLVAELKSEFKVKEMIERYKKSKTADDPLLGRSLYYNAFEALEGITKKKNDTEEIPRIVVFVDDLDRCLPPQGLKLLESIKLVLAQPRFIFVLAVDRRVLEGYLTRRYEKVFGVADYKESGVSYLDKIVQLSLPLPGHRSRFKGFIDDLFKREVFNNELNEPIKQALKDLEEPLAVGSNYNPRNLIRFINNLIVDWNIWAGTGKKTDAKLLSLCAVSRILQQHLGMNLYRRLIRSDLVCNRIAGVGEQEGVEGDLPPDEDKKIELSRQAEKLYEEIMRRLEEADFLAKLLETEAGKSWLSDHLIRVNVDELLVRQWERLEEAALSDKQIIDNAIREMLDKEKDAPITDTDLKKVTALDLRHSKITDTGIIHLKPLTNLRALYLYNTQVTDGGLKHLKSLKKLQELSLRRTKVKGEGLEHLEPLKNLRKLYLAGTEITDEGLKYLEPLKENLRELYLYKTSISDEGLKNLKPLQNLEKLYLGNTKVTDAGLKYLKELKNLRELSLRGTQVTDVSVKALKKALPHCKILL
jgi:hypothetical protein